MKNIIPDWPCAQRVKSVISTRVGGISKGCYAGLNIATHVGDDPDAVSENRHRLLSASGIQEEPLWLEQLHGTRVVTVVEAHQGERADGSFAIGASGVCAVMTADCLPILLTDSEGTRVAAVHAGWRGLAAGVIEQGVHALAVPGSELLAFLGPAIGPAAFEVGSEVREQFCQQDVAAADAFEPLGSGKWLANIYELARQRLRALKINQVYGGTRCTYTESADFFSYRRDGQCGRMVSMIWIDGSE